LSARFEELDRRDTPIGEITLRRRLEPSLQVEVYEVKLGHEFLMSSLFTVAEVALATLALAALPGDELDVVVGGLGLGYTACSVLEHSNVRSLRVVEALDAVIEWHRGRLVPLGAELTCDPRCRLVHGDFFAMVAAGSDFGSDAPRQVHAILVDIDHSPRHVLDPTHESFYEASGLRLLADRLHPGGVFALWADGAPDDDFVAVLGDVFATCVAHVVTFANFNTGEDAASTVYVSTRTRP
jgi:spermidine synthase